MDYLSGFLNSVGPYVHSSLRFETKREAFYAYLKCHNHEHSNSYLNSPHYSTWLNELSGIESNGTGVSCAARHMLRVKASKFGETSIKVDHN